MSAEKEPLVKVPMWDIPVRLFHWSLAAAFIVTWISGEQGELDLHYASGMVLLGLLVFRVLWGFVGSPTARFAHFLRWPQTALIYLRGAFGHGGPSYSFGHNAAGGLMVLALIVLIALETISGMASTDDVLFEGPLYGRLPAWLGDPLVRYHELLGDLLLALAALHILVVLIYLAYKKENLVSAMVVGWAQLPESVARMAVERGETGGAPLWRALVCAWIAAAVPAAIHMTPMD
jgi:cytochrome b